LAAFVLSLNVNPAVAHEYSHGVTGYTSNLDYWSESGALNEGYSDAIAATADRLILGKDPQFVWSLAEDVDVAGVGVRNMADPTIFRDPDHFSDRYTGYEDSGGVHFNVGISNKAFFLMVEGGTHPKSGIVVTPLNATDFDASIAQAATIYFKANTLCLTEASDFLAMRACALLFSNDAQKPTVEAAWDAVGVKAFQQLTAGALVSLSLPYNNDVQIFQLNRELAEGDSVTCWLNSSTGDPNLSVRLGSSPALYPNEYNNDCYSDSRQREEWCMVTAWYNTQVFVAVESRKAATNINLLCTIQEACRSLGSQCTSSAQCCSSRCDGPTAATRVCKNPCLPLNARCASPDECCSHTCAGPSAATLVCKPACRKLNAKCMSPAQCCSRTCDGPTPATRLCKTCQRVGTACARSTQCCAGLTCRKRKCKS
jgi:bacillolysin